MDLGIELTGQVEREYHETLGSQSLQIPIVTVFGWESYQDEQETSYHGSFFKHGWKEESIQTVDSLVRLIILHSQLALAIKLTE